MSADSRRRGPFFSRLIGSLTRPRESAPAGGRDGKRVIALCRALLSERGEVSGARLASDVLAAYSTLATAERDTFFDLLTTEFGPDREKVNRAAGAYLKEPSPGSLSQLQQAVESPRQELYRRLNMAPGGTALLVEMRRQLLHSLPEHPDRAPAAADLLHLLKSWFNRGFLVLERIDWGTAALVLERLIAYEAVHQIQGWTDLRRRLEADRRCYAFFHPSLPDEPLVFIEVALTQGMSTTVQPLIDPQAPVVDPARATAAVFYSITNCQEGLRGVSFGNFLIKQVAEDLGKEFPRIRTFATLSPVPGFRDWLVSDAAAAGYPLSKALSTLLETMNGPDDLDAKSVPATLRAEISRLCAHYLLHAKRNRAPADAVARFHLANGARLERLNWLGDTSPAGLRRSLGLTVNYVYRLKDVERNHEAYARDYDIVASHEFQKLVKP